MQVPVLDLTGAEVGQAELDERVFGIAPNRAVLHQAMVAQLAGARKGTHDTKTRGRVAGGGAKRGREGPPAPQRPAPGGGAAPQRGGDKGAPAAPARAPPARRTGGTAG